jgi:EpsI family protein
MKLISFKHFVIGLCMLAAAGMAMALKPTTKIVDQGPKLDLETLVPKQFDDWKMAENVATLIANPEQTAELNKLYSQMLTRTYVNSHGGRIMLSISYGGDQSDGMQVHKPEVCYPAQGFQILKNRVDVLSTVAGDIPVKRLVASQGQRNEPITYWITVGDTIAVNSLMWKINQVKYGLTGKIPDGLLFRISSIQPDNTAAYGMQDDFARALLDALPPTSRERLIGKPNSAS